MNLGDLESIIVNKIFYFLFFFSFVLDMVLVNLDFSLGFKV
jgi:hypothetical protein